MYRSYLAIYSDLDVRTTKERRAHRDDSIKRYMVVLVWSVVTVRSASASAECTVGEYWVHSLNNMCIKMSMNIFRGGLHII